MPRNPNNPGGGGSPPAPRSPGVRVTPDSGGGPFEYHDPSPPVSDAPRTQNQWFGPWRSRTGGLRGSGAARTEYQLTTSHSVLDSVIPAIYGPSRATGYCALAYQATTWAESAIFGFVFCFGEQDTGMTAADIRINDEPVSTLDWVITTDINEGDGDWSNVSSLLTGSVSGWSHSATVGSDSEVWSRFCTVVMRIDTTNAECPNQLNVTMDVPGQLVTDWTGATDAFTNPLRVLYDIHTNDTVWKQSNAARLDTGVGGSWRTVSDWCDEVMTDGGERWHFNGPLFHRKINAASTEVLGHCFAETYINEEGLLSVWAEMPPEAIDGTWSASGTSLTGSGGSMDATYVGRYGYLEGSNVPVKITAVGGANSFTVDVSITGSSKTFRLYADVYLKKEDWARRPTWANQPQNSAPDYVRVWWTHPEEQGQLYEEEQYGAGTDTRKEITLSGCSTASMAARFADQMVKLENLQDEQWSSGVTITGKALKLDIGDVFLIDDGVDERIPVRLLPPKGLLLARGKVEIPSLVKFDPSVYSAKTKTQVVIPSTIGWSSAAPPNVTSVGYSFTYVGAFDRLASDHDTVGAWSDNNSVTITADATSGPTGLSSGTADKVVANGSLPRIGGAAVVPRAATPIERPFVFLKSASAGVELPVMVSVGGTNPRDVLVREWWRWTPAIGSAANGSIRVELSRGPAMDLYVCGAGSYIPSGDWKHMEEFTWTPPGDISAIREVQLQYTTSFGGTWITHAAVTVSAGSLTWGSAEDADFPPLPASWYDWRFVVVGKNRRITEFPDPSTTAYGGSTTNLQSLEGSKLGQMGAGDVWQIGDPDGGDYSSFLPDGRLTMTGDARPWTDMQIGGLNVRTTGANAPSLAQLMTDGSGSSGVYLYEFPANLKKEVFFTCQLDHAYDPTTDIKPHVHFIPDTTENGNTVRWEFEWTWANVGDTYGANTTLATVDDTDDFVANEHSVHGLGTISGTGKKESSILICRLARLGNDAADTYTGSVYLSSIDIHYQLGKLGTDDEFPV